ncbi:MAG: bestrophin family ion channel [Planctomycetota bacterium]
MRRAEFWSEVFTLQGTITPFVQSRVAVFTVFSLIVWMVTATFGLATGFEVVAPYEIIGAVLALLLVIRTNAGYDRWYEGRKIWGGIVNQSRNLAQIGLAYGPEDPAWRKKFVGWVAAFSHSSRLSLRDERDVEDMRHLIGDEATEQLAFAQHMPMQVAMQIAAMLREALEQGKLDRFAFLQAEHERAQLIDHIGACERIKKTPSRKSFRSRFASFSSCTS